MGGNRRLPIGNRWFPNHGIITSQPNLPTRGLIHHLESQTDAPGQMRCELPLCFVTTPQPIDHATNRFSHVVARPFPRVARAASVRLQRLLHRLDVFVELIRAGDVTALRCILAFPAQSRQFAQITRARFRNPIAPEWNCAIVRRLYPG